MAPIARDDPGRRAKSGEPDDCPICAQARYLIPWDIVERDGPFEEFKQDGAVVSVELADGRTYGGVLLVYPNEIWAMDGYSELPFDPQSIKRIFQTEHDLADRSKSSWGFFGSSRNQLRR